MSDVQGRAPWGSLAKPERRAPKEPRPLNRIGKVARARAADKREKLKAEPANFEGYRTCYLCHRWSTQVDLEHIKDASTHPELRHDPENAAWSCRDCNSSKKRKGRI